VADRRAFGGERGGSLGPFARGVVKWVAVFLVLGLVVAAGNRSGLALVAIPFLGATIVAGCVELARRALGHR